MSQSYILCEDKQLSHAKKPRPIIENLYAKLLAISSLFHLPLPFTTHPPRRAGQL